MQNIQWEMMAQFIFPAQLGIVEEVVSVDIKPRWQEVETEDSIRLTGIYHIMAVVRFNPSQTPRFSEGTFIEHIEFDGNNGYFEYALPFEVDLPREKIDGAKHPQIDIKDLSFFIFDGSSCLFKWDACCLVSGQEDTNLLDQTPAETKQVTEPDNVYEQETVESTQTALPELQQPNEAEQPVEAQDGDSTTDVTASEAVQEPLVADPEIALNEQIEHAINEKDDTLGYLDTSVHLPTYGEVIEEQQAGEPTNITRNELEEQERLTQAQPVVEQKERIVETLPVVEQKEQIVETSPVVEQKEQIVETSPVVEQKEQIAETSPVAKRKGQNVLHVQSEQGQEEENEKTSYLPTDTDDFYNQLTESYTVLKLSNNIIRE